jgi:hypothetical protein
VDNKAHTAGIVLVLGMVQTLGLGRLNSAHTGRTKVTTVDKSARNRLSRT